MPQEEEIIILEHTKPIRCQKAFFYADPLFVDRLKALSPALAALGKKLPSQEELEYAAFEKGELQIAIAPLDIASLWESSQKRLQSVVPVRPFRPDEIAHMKAHDIANYEEMKQSLYRILPGFSMVEKAMADLASKSAAPAA